MNLHQELYQGCGICQQFKINQNLSAPSFNPIPGPTTTRPFTNLSMDLITDLPPITLDNGTGCDLVHSGPQTYKGGDSYPLFKNPHWRRCWRNPTPSCLQTIQTPQHHHLWSRPTISFQELLKLLGIKLKLMTAYRPQSDGTMEHFNQEIEAYIGIYCSLNPETWHKSINTMEFTHNNWQHSD